MVNGITNQGATVGQNYSIASISGASESPAGYGSNFPAIQDVVQLSPEAQAAYDKLPSWGKHDADVIYDVNSTVAEKLAAYSDATLRTDSEWQGTTGDLITRAANTPGFYFGAAIEGSHFAVIADAVGEQLAGVRYGSIQDYQEASLAAGGQIPPSNVVVPISSPQDAELAQGISAVDTEVKNNDNAFWESGNSPIAPTLSSGSLSGQADQTVAGGTTAAATATPTVAKASSHSPTALYSATAALSVLADYESDKGDHATTFAATTIPGKPQNKS